MNVRMCSCTLKMQRFESTAACLLGSILMMMLPGFLAFPLSVIPPTLRHSTTRASIYPMKQGCHSFRVRGSLLFARSPSQGADDSQSDLDDLWLDDALDELVFSEGGEPDAFLSDDDLALLHDINISSLISSAQNGSYVSLDEVVGPQILSTKDLSRLSSDLSYFYLRDELGLGEDVMWKIMNSAGSLLGMKASNLRSKVEMLRKTIKLSDEDLRELLASMPQILQRSANKHLSPTILFLVRQLDLGTKELRSLVLGCPAALLYTIPNLQKKLEFFQNTMGFSVEETRRLLLKEPRLLRCSVKEGLMSRYRFLHKEVAIPRDEIGTMVQKNPLIMMMSVDKNLQPKLIFFMIMTLMLTPEDVRKILLKFPEILNYSLENHIVPITQYFRSLDMSVSEVANMLLKFPRLVTNSLVKIKYVVGYLRFELGLDADGVRRILYQAPQVISLAPANLERKVDYLLQVVVPGGTRGNVDSTKALRNLIVGMPSLLYLNIEKNLNPKVEFLRSRLGIRGFSEALDRLPMLLAYSLDKRIRPRLDMILDAGVEGGSITVGIPKKEKDFLDWLDARVRKAKKKPSATTSGTSINNEENHIGLEARTEPMVGRGVHDDGRIVHWTRPRRPRQ